MRITLLVLSLIVATPLAAQDTTAVALTVEVRRDTMPAVDVLVRVGSVTRHTDDRGVAVLRVQPGERQIVAARIGFRPETVTVMVRVGGDTTVTIALTEHALELSGVVVSATRSGRRIEDEPLRVEVLAEEEVEEKLLMTPGDITMMLNESPGLRVQNASPSLGSANVRVQGLRGRYTQLLSDGLPLHGQVGGLGLLQIPPMDLGGVEIIKGAASALYGGGALGGVINLISRRPGESPEAELLLNQTTLDGTDLVGFAARQFTERWGATLLTGAHRQRGVDRDDDAWMELPAYERLVVRPRLFWTGGAGRWIMATAGGTYERRDAGETAAGSRASPGPYRELLRTNRTDAGLVSGFPLNESSVLSVRGSWTRQRRGHMFGPERERDTDLSALVESSVTLDRGRSLWVIGAAVQHERHRGRDVRAFDYTFTTPGAFAQGTFTLSDKVSVTASARVDDHSEYGFQLAPRLSLLGRLTRVWSVRVSGGAGYFASTAFIEEVEAIGARRIAPDIDLREEKAITGSVDLGGAVGPLEVNITAFASSVTHPVGLVDGPTPSLVNRMESTRTSGGELLLRWVPEPFHVTGSYTFVRSSEEPPGSPGERRETYLTPRHQAGLVTMWELEGRARVGVEAYYTGRQRLEDPFGGAETESASYVHLGALAERRFGPVRVFINGENLLDYRQAEHGRFVLATRRIDGRWTADAWGPLEGRVANVGVRVDLFPDG